MAIPEASREQIIAALELFDRELRQRDEWIGWEQRENHKYALSYEGRHYPVKQIVSLATGAPVNTYISTEARRFLKTRTFTVIPIQRTQRSARHVGDHAEQVYSATEQFIERALRQDDSLFTPGQAIWTTANIDDLYRRFRIELDTSRDSFMNKFERQLADAAPDVIQLAAEMMFVHVLFASRNSIDAPRKRELITTILKWSPSPVNIPSDLFDALQQGLATMGVAFGTYRQVQLGFLLEFVRRWKELPTNTQTQLLDAAWNFKEWLFGIPMHTAYIQREAILHLIHPDTFEAIVSRDHKQQIAQAFANYVERPTSDIDQQLAQIRQRLSRQYGEHFTFYQEDVRRVWQEDGHITHNSATSPGDPSPIAESYKPALPRSLGPRLQTYIRFAVRLDRPSYTAEELVTRLGQISPPLVRTKPDADDLVTDLLLLRLLEPLPDGRYRRWAHLRDATETPMLRYAALTLLLPAEGQDDVYELPILRVPSDGQPHPESDWPGGAGLLAWYEEADLVEQSGGGWRLSPSAFSLEDASTPTAEAINIFLHHLRRAQISQESISTIATTLRVLDPQTLDERIAEIQRELLIDRQTILRIYRSLIAGRHVILSGPPGTGKTHLARMLPRILWRDESTVLLTLPTQPSEPPTADPVAQPIRRDGYDVEVVTATEDWGTRHVIGGIVPQLQQDGARRSLVYGIQHGHLTRTVLQNYGGDGQRLPADLRFTRQEIQADAQRYLGRWLVIDEFTRAPIDAAFGSLLTTLGGQSGATLHVPTDSGVDRPVPLPQDFRLIGTLNSFDRHFLNQISEAMKRRFTFIDVLPPDRAYAEAEQAVAVYRALTGLAQHGLAGITVQSDRLTWAGHVEVQQDTASERDGLLASYTLNTAQPVRDTLAGFWRIFQSIRIYRQLGTAQAETVYATLFAGKTIGMSWPDALDSALADVLVDQLQVLARDEQRVLLALIEHAGDLPSFTRRVQQILKDLPRPRQVGHLAQLKSTGVPTAADIDGNDASTLQPAQLHDLFRFDLLLRLSATGLFARRLYAFVNEKGL